MNNEKRKYVFVLGFNPALCLAEILSVLGKKGGIEIISFSEEVLLVRCDTIDIGFINYLGGTKKIIEVLQEVEEDKSSSRPFAAAREINKKDYNPDLVIKNMAEIIFKYFNRTDKKIIFGLSVYHLNAPEPQRKGSKRTLFSSHAPPSYRQVQRKKKIYFLRPSEEIIKVVKSLKYICVNLKKNLKNNGFKLAFLNTNKRCLSNATVIKYKLMAPNGIEGVIIVSKKNILIGKTIAVKDIYLYNKLDMGRPVRDIVSGTTPPKLAKIMINLTCQNFDALMVDLFCGSGTILQEMLLLGYKNVIGSDISQKAIDDTKKNLNWLNQNFIKNGAKYKIYQADARATNKFLKPNTVDAVVSEGYLGPPLRAYLKTDQLNKLIADLSNLYCSVFENLYKILKKDGVVVLALPIFKTRDNLRLLPIMKGVKSSGFKIFNPLNTLNNRAQEFYKYFTERESIIYSRPDQLVLREIIVLKKS